MGETVAVAAGNTAAAVSPIKEHFPSQTNESYRFAI